MQGVSAEVRYHLMHAAIDLRMTFVREGVAVSIALVTEFVCEEGAHIKSTRPVLCPLVEGLGAWLRYDQSLI